MYTIAIPIINRTLDCEGALAELRRAGATRVWLCTARGIESEDRLETELRLLKEHRLFFERNGLEVGVWLGSLGHGGALAHDNGQPMLRTSAYVRLVGLGGGSCEDSFCPSCEPFATDYSEWIGRIAETGARMIMLDDDYRLSLHSAKGPGCCCDRHMAEYRRRVGEPIGRDRMEKLIFAGGPSKYRDAWLDMGRDALLGLARRIRARVDRVDPSVRVGVCAVMGTWDADGVNAMELTKALAGGAKPFLRTIGAPYWAAQNALAKKLNHIVELARIQRYWCEGSGIEVFSEGDVYPRPRFSTPASYLEMYDMILRADGGLDGILKYMIDYTASLSYERGYIDRMVKNAPAYEWIAAHMAGGQAEGADVVCRFDRLRGAILPDDGTADDAHDRFYPSAQRLLADCSVPMAYGTHGAHVICGDNGRTVDEPLLNDGAVLDIVAALRLTERGVDVGLAAAGPFETRGGPEYFPAGNETVACGAAKRFCRAALKPGAEALSFLNGEPSCWRYENAAGQRFLVYAFDMQQVVHAGSPSLSRSYCRQRQLVEGLEWVGRRRLSAVCLGNPDLYIMAKRTDEGLAVGLWNLSADYVPDALIRLDRAYGGASFFGCAGEVAGDSVRLSGDIAPFAFAGVLLKN